MNAVIKQHVTGNEAELQNVLQANKLEVISRKHMEREENMIQASKRTVEEAYKYRGRFIQSSIHNFTSRLFNGRENNHGKKSGRRK